MNEEQQYTTAQSTINSNQAQASSHTKSELYIIKNKNRLRRIARRTKYLPHVNAANIPVKEIQNRIKEHPNYKWEKQSPD